MPFMTRRALAAVLIALLVVAGALWVLDGDGAPSAPAAPPNPLTPHTPRPSAFSWKLTAAQSGDRVLVLEVETAKPEEALIVARQLTDLHRDRFDEVLVYFFEPDVIPRRATLRVQWTRANGYATLALREPRRPD